jgi:hypothetical protein
VSRGLLSRRRFLASCGSGLLGACAFPATAVQQPRAPGNRAVIRDIGTRLRSRFADLPQHFIFEYYPWYGTSPLFHWDGSGRTPPVDIAASSMPALGAYDSRSTKVLEQHARWIAESGVGAINLSWWGRDTFEDRAVPVVMDVMRAHGLFVTFHLEPYGPERGQSLVSDVRYLLREYGERRRWDAFLLLEHADGSIGPVLKTFASMLPERQVDCLGVSRPERLYVSDDVGREQISRLRREMAGEFDRFTLLGDSGNVKRTLDCGFDGFAVYDPYVRPESWAPIARTFSREDLLFSFPINAGFDGIEPRTPPADPCYRSPQFEPPLAVRWDIEEGLELAHRVSDQRIGESFDETLRLQTDPASSNARRGFFLVYITSFNEWHEGTQFEPMKSRAQLTEAERRLGYHNPGVGDYRLKTLEALLRPVVGG